MIEQLMGLGFLLELFVQVCAPIFVVVGLGWVLDRKFRLHLESMVKLNIYLMVPAFIFCRVVDTELEGGEALKIVIFTLATIASMFVLSVLLGNWLGLGEQRKRALNLSTMFYNCGNYGLPLVTLAFGHEGAAVQVYVIATMNVATFTIGLFLSQESGGPDEVGRHWKTLMKVLRQPTLYALGLGILCRSLGLQVQQITWLWQPLDLIQSGLIGFALVTLGVQMSQTKPEPFRAPLLGALMTRLIGGPLVGVGLALWLNVPPMVMGSLILAAGAPTAVNTALLAHEFKGDVSFATSTVYYSTLFSMLTTTISLATLKLWLG